MPIRPAPFHPPLLLRDRSSNWSTRVKRYLLVAIGGALGAMLRYSIGMTAAERFGTRFPVGTLSINISACFLIGFVLEYIGTHTGVSLVWRYAFVIGFIGAFSTFSSFEWDIWSELTTGAFWIAILYVVISLVAGLIAVGLGSATARTLA
jgi:CrcB protein